MPKKNPPPLPAAPSLPCAGTGSRVLCINELRTSCSELKLIQHTWRKSSFLTQGSRGATTPTKSNLGKRRTQSCFTHLHQNLQGQNAVWRILDQLGVILRCFSSGELWDGGIQRRRSSVLSTNWIFSREQRGASCLGTSSWQGFTNLPWDLCRGQRRDRDVKILK